MNHEARALYREVLDEIWLHGSVPTSVEEIAQLTKTPIEVVSRAWPVVHDCLMPLKKNPDKLTSERLEEERRKRNSIKKKRKDAAQKRWDERANAMQMHSTSKANGMQDYAIQVTSNKIQVTSNTHTQRFDEFWTEYPKKAGKASALKAWNRIKPDEILHAKILAKVREFKESHGWKKDGGQFIPYPATWLNAGQWDDEVTQAKAAVMAPRSVQI